jgi:hypothetical protein
MFTPFSPSPNIQSMTSHPLHPQVLCPTSRFLRLLPLPQSTYYPTPKFQSSRVFGFTATNTRLPCGVHHHLHQTTPAHSPSSLPYSRLGGLKPNLSSRYSGRPPLAPFLLSAADNVRDRPRLCRYPVVFYARTHILVHVPSNRRDRSAASSSLSNQAFVSIALRKKSMTTESLVRTSSGAPERTRMGTRSSHSRHQVNAPTTTRFSSALSVSPTITQSQSKTVPLYPVRCRWQEQRLSGR